MPAKIIISKHFTKSCLYRTKHETSRTTKRIHDVQEDIQVHFHGKVQFSSKSYNIYLFELQTHILLHMKS